MQQWILSLVAAGSLATVTTGAIINVPGDFSTIQGAIEAAQDGDEVVVAPGTWAGPIDLVGKPITVRSSDGPSVTTISGGGTVVTFANLEGPDTVLEGFTITAGSALEGGGMLLEFSDPTVASCTFDGNNATRGGAIFVVGSTGTFTDCTFVNNVAADLGGAAYCNASSCLFDSCIFDGNEVDAGGGRGGAMYNVNFSNTVVMGSTFSANSASRRGGGVANVAFSGATFEDCSFTTNSVGSSSYAWGGAVYNEDSSPMFIECEFIDNLADAAGSGSTARGHGGAIYNLGSSPISLACQFLGNTADGAQSSNGGRGGAVFNNNSNSTFMNSSFDSNLATAGIESNDNDTGLGGALFNVSSDVSITGCAFDTNIADAVDEDFPDAGLGGAMYIAAGMLSVSDSTFTGNQAQGGVSGASHGIGGAIYNSGVLTIEGTTFAGNVADNGSGSGSPRALGGAIYSDDETTLYSCTFNANAADVNGGAVYHTGGSFSDLIVVESSFFANVAVLGSSIFNAGTFDGSRIINCDFRGNLTGVSGGIYNDDSSPDVFNCLFSGNSASSFGGGIFNFDDSDPLIVNCTFAGNEAFAGAAVHNFSSNSTASVHNTIAWSNVNANGEDLDGTGPHTVTFSNIEGGVSGTGNIDADPLFVDPDGLDGILGTDDDNLRLLTGSPSIDAGDNGALPQDSADLDGDTNTDEVIPFDLDGNDRIIDGDGDKSAIVDMGAYEAALPICPWDLDGSGDVGVTDLLALLAAWGPNPGHPADFNGDGTIGVTDFLELLANWGPCP